MATTKTTKQAKTPANKKDEHVSFSYDDLKILGVIGENVFIKGTVDFEEDCVLIIDRELFKSTIDIWLNDKKSYCERYNYFCGQMGSITVTSSVERKKKDRINIRIEEELKFVRTFEVISFDNYTNMEHG